MPDNVQPVRPAFGPQALSLLQHCFEDAWWELAGNFAAAEADRRIHECTARIGAYHQGIAARAKNPLAAQQAAQLLPVALQHLKQLREYRRRLEHALRMEAYPSTQVRPSRWAGSIASPHALKGVKTSPACRH